VEVYRRCPGHEPDGVIIRLPDDTRCLIPGWMLDPAACAVVRDETEPRISSAALLQLRQLLDAQPCIDREDVSCSGTYLSPGVTHESINENQKPATSAGLRQKSAGVGINECLSEGCDRPAQPSSAEGGDERTQFGEDG